MQQIKNNQLIASLAVFCTAMGIFLFVENGKRPDVRTEPVYPTFSTVTLLTVTLASSSVWTAVRQ